MTKETKEKTKSRRKLIVVGIAAVLLVVIIFGSIYIYLRKSNGGIKQQERKDVEPKTDNQNTDSQASMEQMKEAHEVKQASNKILKVATTAVGSSLGTSAAYLSEKKSGNNNLLGKEKDGKDTDDTEQFAFVDGSSGNKVAKIDKKTSNNSI